MDGPAGKQIALGLSKGEKGILTSPRSLGSPLLQLPTEILPLISRHFTASEWAQGPCLACRLLCYLELPHLSLYPHTDVSGMEDIKSCPANCLVNIGRDCSKSCRLIAIRVGRALLWTGRRTGDSKVALVLGTAKRQGSDKEAAQKIPVDTHWKISDDFPLFGHIKSLDSMGIPSWRDIIVHMHGTNALGFHDQYWLYRGIRAVEQCELGRWVDAVLDSWPAQNGT